MVSSEISPRLSGEKDETLKAIMKLGEHLATGKAMKVHGVVFRLEGVVFNDGGGVDLHREGYLGAFLKCSTGACDFDMHMTIAKWDVMKWLQTATFGCDEGVDWEALKTEFNQWRNEWAPTLRSIKCLDIEFIIGTRTAEERWRVIMKPRKKSKLARDISAMKCLVENAWCLATYNRYEGSLHFSLDRWDGVLP